MSTKTHNQKVKITKSVVDKSLPPDQGQAFLRDTFLNGFGLRITASGRKSFIVEKRINGKVKRITLGRYGELTVEQARTQAMQFLGKIAQGIDPIQESRKRRIQSTSLAQAYKKFKSARKNLKPKTLYDYERFMQVPFKDWQNKPLVDITKNMVAEKHSHLGKTSGPAYANSAMRFLRSLLNYAMAAYDDETGHTIILENPVCVLSRTRAWYPSPRRQNVIKAHRLPAWFEAVNELRNKENTYFGRTVGDYLLFLLFTGLRRQEAAQLLWEHVDLKDRTLIITDPKNHQPLTLPLSDFLYDLLKGRYQESINEYVFSGKEGEGYLIEPKRQMQKVIDQSEIHFILHDLRRTFITFADSIEISPYAIKRLVNRKMKDDITAGYIISDVDRLRKPMQKITDALVKASKAFKENKVIFLENHPIDGLKTKKTLEAV